LTSGHSDVYPYGNSGHQRIYYTFNQLQPASDGYDWAMTDLYVVHNAEQFGGHLAAREIRVLDADGTGSGGPQTRRYFGR